MWTLAHFASVLRDLHVAHRFRRQTRDRKYGSIHQAKLCSGTAKQSSSDRPNNIQQEDTRMEGKATSMRREINFLGFRAGKGDMNALHLRSSWERKRFSLG
jgi:hypothetical protein